MFLRKIIIVATMALIVVGCRIETPARIQGENVKKVELYKNFPYNKYYVISNGKKQEVNKNVYNSIK